MVIIFCFYLQYTFLSQRLHIQIHPLILLHKLQQLLKRHHPIFSNPWFICMRQCLTNVYGCMKALHKIFCCFIKENAAKLQYTFLLLKILADYFNKLTNPAPFTIHLEPLIMNRKFSIECERGLFSMNSRK